MFHHVHYSFYFPQLSSTSYKLFFEGSWHVHDTTGVVCCVFSPVSDDCFAGHFEKLTEMLQMSFDTKQFSLRCPSVELVSDIQMLLSRKTANKREDRRNKKIRRDTGQDR